MKIKLFKLMILKKKELTEDGSKNNTLEINSKSAIIK